MNDELIRMRIPADDKAEAIAWSAELRVSLSHFMRDAVRARCKDLNEKRASAGLGALFEYVREQGDGVALRDGASVRLGGSRESSTT